ncbi:MAG: tRNA preQ1(34) S-adenosylmethionine ribosyltransferase-isomerase QueA [Deltaproteobacteria bacterium]|nr:tRNA preQ1(34) S-adenosylmethionine ribosyltransferase-isomerase QueA [Deltaproteobacteria bacterium]
MNLQDFDYHLPRRLIAQHPLDKRDHSRLMVLSRRTGAIEHRIFTDLPEYLEPGDVLAINETKVLPVRLIGKKQSGGKVELILVRKIGRDEEGERFHEVLNRDPGENEEHASEWECLVKNSGRLREHTLLIISDNLQGEFRKRVPSGLWRVRLKSEGNLEKKLREIGFPPLPPYIRRNGDRKMRDQDLQRYQTVYAREEGAIAAPTAGLHFTESLLDEIRGKGVSIFPLILHVGVGTFLPVKQKEVEKHRLEPEFFNIPPKTAQAVNQARASGKRVVAVGTTVTRALESGVDAGGKIRAKRGETSLFVIPGFTFRAVDGLITNFHLPRSTLMMLVSALGGKEFIMAAYQEAVKKNYRFYSYGDAMLII